MACQGQHLRPSWISRCAACQPLFSQSQGPGSACTAPRSLTRFMDFWLRREYILKLTSTKAHLGKPRAAKPRVLASSAFSEGPKTAGLPKGGGRSP